MTSPTGDTKREQEVAALFEKGGTAARAALSSARDACSRQAQTIVDLKSQIDANKGNVVDDETLASWTSTVDAAVANAAEIQKAFDAIGVPPGEVTPPEIPGYTPPTERPIIDNALPGQPVIRPIGGSGSGSQGKHR